MSQLSQLSALLEGSYCMSETPLTAYHAAREVMGAMRARDAITKFNRAKQALKNWNVIVSYCSNGQTRVYRADKNLELFLGKSLWPVDKSPKPHASDCAYWVQESCDCVTGR